MRKFISGAIRNEDSSRINYEKGLSPIVLRCYGEFMRRHNKCSDGSYRDEGNWKKGFTKQSYMESKFRHFMETWLLHDGFLDEDIKDELREELKHEPTAIEIEDRYFEKLLESLCAEFFNTMGYMHVVLLEQAKAKLKRKKSSKIAESLANVIKACGLKANEVLAIFKNLRKKR